MLKNNENLIPTSVFGHFCLKVLANAGALFFCLALALMHSPAFLSSVIAYDASTPPAITPQLLAEVSPWGKVVRDEEIQPE
jgi:hypothetical protein